MATITRNTLQGQPVTTQSFGAGIAMPLETGYAYLPSSHLSSVGIQNAPPANTFGTKQSPSSVSGVFDPQGPATPVGVIPTQGNGVPTATTNGPRFNRGKASPILNQGRGVFKALFG